MMNFSIFKNTRELALFITDIFMLLLVVINLIWMSIDWFFISPLVKNWLEQIVPPFFHFYNDYIHHHFLLFDGIFVTIFIIELLIRWTIAIRRKSYHKWFFYPFIHWYDVLGCIPLGTFRFLRLLRIISMIFRLQKLGVIDVRNTYFYKIFKKYYEILVEEVSDRVVVKVIEDVQDEIKGGTPVTDKMITEVIKPHKEALVEWLSNRVRLVAKQNYALHKEEIKQYMKKLMKEAVAKNVGIKQLKKVPFVGNIITASIVKSIGDITFNIINIAVEDLVSDHNNKVIEEITNIVFDVVLMEEKDEELNKIALNIMVDSLELMKEQVKIQQWKLKEQ
ncbi:MAG: ion transporter [Bacteroidetes bacterium]|nr:ion transporter [Bacteroidota bacterium]